MTRRQVSALVIGGVVSAAGVGAAFAEKHTGGDFLIFCNTSRFEAEVNCSMFVDGVVTGNFMANPSPVFCIPESVTVGQLKSVATKYLLQHPEQHHRPFAGIVIRSMAEAFPCR